MFARLLLMTRLRKSTERGKIVFVNLKSRVARRPRNIFPAFINFVVLKKITTEIRIVTTIFSKNSK